jgi:hypothetical protein
MFWLCSDIFWQLSNLSKLLHYIFNCYRFTAYSVMKSRIGHHLLPPSSR